MIFGTPWWETIYANIFYLFILLLVAYVIYRRKVSNIKDEKIILENKLSELTEELSQSENRLKYTLSAAKAGTFVRDVEKDKLFFDKRAQEILGIEQSELTLESWVSLLHPDDVEFISTEIVEGLKAQLERIEFTYRIVLPNSEIRHILAQSYNAYNKLDGSPVTTYGIIFDISEQKRAEKELLDAKEAAENASEAKNTFLANMSHEIRTPLSAIIGFMELLYETPVNDMQKAYLTKTNGAAHALFSLLGDILDFSKIEAGKLDIVYDSFNPDDILNDSIDIFELEAEEKGVLLTYEIDSNIPKYLIGDAHRIEQVVVNFISNAIKFTENGSIHISLNMQQLNTKGCTIEISVSDSGIGIRQEDLSTLFDHFSQVDSSLIRKKGGTGLGLAISKQLVEAMGGSIYVESEYGSGSTFAFELELDLVPKEWDLENKQVEDKILFENLKILLVEDNLYNREIAYALLLGMGVEVDVAENGEIALKLIRSNNYDLVLMDIQMPVMDGITATKALKKEGFDNLPIVAFSAQVSKADRKRILDAGMIDFLNKPFKSNDLKELLIEYFPHKLLRTTAVKENLPCWIDNVEPIPDIELHKDMCEYWQNQDDFFHNLKRFIASVKEDAKQLSSMIKGNSISSVKKLLHKLKGSSKFYGANKLFSAIEAFEIAISESSYDISILEKAIDESVSELLDFIE